MTDTERIEKLEAELAALRMLVDHMARGGVTTLGAGGKVVPAPVTLTCNMNPFQHHYTGADGKCVCQSYSTGFAGSQ